MYDVELCHLGDNCEPGILLDDILYINGLYFGRFAHTRTRIHYGLQLSIHLDTPQ